MEEIYDKNEILHKAMWNIYKSYKSDNFTFPGYSDEDKIDMINYVLPFFEMIEEYEICSELCYHRNNFKKTNNNEKELHN